MKNYINRFASLGFATLLLTLAACKAEPEVDETVEEILAAQPTITSFSPTTASIQSTITITGTFLNFATTAFIGDTECTITQRVNGNTLEVLVPSNAQSGKIKIVTSSDKEATSADELTVTYPQPNVTSSFPSQAFVNEVITLEGVDLQTITKVTFDNIEAPIQFQEEKAVVFTIPNSGGAGQSVKYFYNSQNGESSVDLSTSFEILVPTPQISQYPGLMTRDNEVTLVGTDMNLITEVSVGSTPVVLNTTSATSLSFNVPSNITTGYQSIQIKFGDAGVLTEDSIPYINGEYEEYFNFDAYPATVVTIDDSKDPLATGQLNGTVSQPPFQGVMYYNLQMNTGTGSTIGRLKIHDETVNASWSTILDGTSFGGTPVLHFWVNTEGTEPIFKIYIGGTASANRRELPGSDLNTGGDNWDLIAVQLDGFIPGLAGVGGTFEFRFNTGSTASTFPVIINMDMIFVTDKVLTEFGALDKTDDFKPAG